MISNPNLVLLPVSNEVPEHPCVSPVSNQVFERRLIEKYIAENGADPINGQPLSEEQLIDIKGTGACVVHTLGPPVHTQPLTPDAQRHKRTPNL